MNRNHFGKRYVSAKEMVDYAKALALPHVDRHLLEFLEREQLLVPRVRLDVPESVERSLWLQDHPGFADPTLSIATQEEMAPMQIVIKAMSALHLPGPISKAPLDHPFDLPELKQSPVIARHISGGRPFRPWTDYRIRMGQSKPGKPLFEDQALSNTYYADWQLLMLAECLAMYRIQYANLTSTSIGDALLPDGTSADRSVTHVNWEGVHGLKELKAVVPCLDVISWWAFLRNRLLERASWVKTMDGFAFVHEIGGSAAQQLRDAEHQQARRCVADANITLDMFVSAIQTLCTRWDEWKDKDRSRLAEHYRDIIGVSVKLCQLGFDVDLQTVIDRVGRPTGHGEPTLDVLFPDWLEEHRNTAMGFLQREWNAAQPLPSPKTNLPHVDLDAFFRWLDSNGHWEIYWHISVLDDLWRRLDDLGHAGLAASTRSLANAIEVFTNDIGAALPGFDQNSTLKPKWGTLWCDAVVIDSGFASHWGTKTRSKTESELKSNLIAIAILPTSCQEDEILKVLLQAGLIRNHGTHNGLLSLDRNQLVGVYATLLKAVILTWDHARQRGLLPGFPP